MAFILYIDRSNYKPNFKSEKAEDKNIIYSEIDKEFYRVWMTRFLVKNFACQTWGRMIITDSQKDFGLLLNHFCRSYLTRLKRVNRKKFLFLYNNLDEFDKKWVTFCDDAESWLKDTTKQSPISGSGATVV